MRKKRRSKQKLAEAAHVAHNAQADREAVLGGLLAQLLCHRATGRVEGRPIADDVTASYWADGPASYWAGGPASYWADPAALRRSAEVGACAMPAWAAALDLVSPRLPESVPEIVPEIVPEWVALDLTDGWIPVEVAVAAVNTPALRATVPSATQSLGGFVYSAPDVCHAAKLPVVKEGVARYDLSEDAKRVRMAVGGIPRPRAEADNSEGVGGIPRPLAEADNSADAVAEQVAEAEELTEGVVMGTAEQVAEAEERTQGVVMGTVGVGGGADERTIEGKGEGSHHRGRGRSEAKGEGEGSQRTTEAEGGAVDAHDDAVHKVDSKHEPRESSNAHDDAVAEAPKTDPEMTAALHAALRTPTRRPSEESPSIEASSWAPPSIEASSWAPPSIEASLHSAIKREPAPDTSPYGWYLPALEICASRAEAVRSSKSHHHHHHHHHQQQQQQSPPILSASASPAAASPAAASPAAASPASASPAYASPAAASPPAATERVAPRPMALTIRGHQRSLEVIRGHQRPMPLTIATAPPLAVHGWFGMHAERLTKLGLTRMLRHHTPLLRREAAASVSSSSSGPRPFDYYIWVDVHRAIENGVAFYHGRPVAGQGEVMLRDDL